MHQSDINEKNKIKAPFLGVDKPSLSPDLSSFLHALCFLSFLSSVCAILILAAISPFSLGVSILVCLFLVCLCLSGVSLYRTLTKGFTLYHCAVQEASHEKGMGCFTEKFNRVL